MIDPVSSTLAFQPIPMGPDASRISALRQEPSEQQPSEEPQSEELREKFHQFVGETFFGQLLSSMRKTVGKPAYFHGGRAEEVFQGQLDQWMVQHMSEASAESFADPMFELFNLRQAQ